MNKKDDECLDQANRECLEEHDNQGDVGDKLKDCNEEVMVNLRDSEMDDNGMKVCHDQSVDVRVVESDGKVSFGSINDDMLKMYDGVSRNDRSNEDDMQGIKETEQGNNQGKSNGKVQNKGVESDKNDGKFDRKFFVEAIVQNLMECDKTLECIPTEIDENGAEVVVFDDIMVAKGSKRWNLTLCGFFVGYRMPVTELRYNLRRMWSRYGFKDIVDCHNGVFFMKFHHEEGLNQGISALASRVGNPLVVDSVNANKCKQGLGILRENPQVSKVGNNTKTMYQAKKNAKEDKSPNKTPIKTAEKGVDKDGKEENESLGNINKKWSVHKDILDVMKSIDMIAYYKQKSDLLVDKGVNIEVESNEEFKDVLEEISGVAKCMEGNEVKGLSSSKKHDEVMKLIQEEKLQICVILETHLKSKKIGKVCDIIYGRWNWFTNMSFCNKGCRIMVGWNDDVINLSVIHMARQSVLVKVVTRDGNMKLHGTFIYASNSGLERKELLKDLEIYKRIVGNEPWFLSGDLNVTLTPKEHYIGSSTMSSDMQDF
ncbi:RNA-directed DNA polymerase, eukaryota, reverse transcriptase zinc-binding domain protein [Tanacetum coccineum]|uniref:RNA-directed DNA polymerase, eukaryota, reverse transcriptase zinc-binding domain protein n=1 Tax=Tanacetum coccineum TaxID=301880 RepID=A0ABQ5I7J1_9ASTR